MKLFEIMRTNERPVKIHLEPWMFSSVDDIERWIDTIHEEMDNYTDISMMDDHELVANSDLTIHASNEYVKKYHDDRPDEAKLGEHLKGRLKELMPNILVHHGNDLLLPVQFKSSTHFSLKNVPVTSLIGCPYVVHGNFLAYGTLISDMHGFPKVITGSARVTSRQNIEDLTGMDPNTRIGQEFRLLPSNECKIVSLKGLPKSIKIMEVGSVGSFDGIQDSGIKDLRLNHHSQYSGVLRLLQAPMLDEVEVPNEYSFDYERRTSKVSRMACIITKHLNEDRDMISCKKELISLGLGEFVK